MRGEGEGDETIICKSKHRNMFRGPVPTYRVNEHKERRGIRQQTDMEFWFGCGH
jgi:hypothetical protein